MSHDDMVTALLTYIATDANLIALMRLQATRAISGTLTDTQLTTICQALGLYTGP